MPLGPVPMFPPVPGAFGAETSPVSSVIATTGGASTKTVLPVGWVQGILGAHSTLQANVGSTAISTLPSTLALVSTAFGPIFSDGASFSIVDDTTGSVSWYWGLRGGNFG